MIPDRKGISEDAVYLLCKFMADFDFRLSPDVT